MTSRTPVAWRPTSLSASVLGLLACVAGALALGAAPALAAEACPNEQLRKESRINASPTAEGKSYSQLLPDCRAYEMVSPLYKQGHDALPLAPYGGLPVAPGGETVGFQSEGAFSEPLNYKVGTLPQNPYLAQRSTSGWITSSALPPANLVDLVTLNGLEAGDSSLDLRSVRVGCGPSNAGKGEGLNSGSQGVVCAVHKLGGEWEPATPDYPSLLGNNQGGEGTSLYLGASSDLSRVFIQPPVSLVLGDTANAGFHGIYEIAGVGTGSPVVLRLVNVDNQGTELLRKSGAQEHGPLFGDRIVGTGFAGSAYHAISQSGETVFFTATPKGSEIDTLYARVPCVSGLHCAYVEKVDKEGRVEKEGPTNVRAEPTGRETVAVSAPSPECTGACASSPAANATFQAASADGSKVFFTTVQKLLNSDNNAAYDLYEYDLVTKKLILISGGSPGTEVQGLVRSSSDGSHVYFVEGGVLTTEKVINENTYRNEKGKEAHEEASAGANLYGYDTVTGETKFVAHSGFGSGLPESIEEVLAGERFGDEESFDAYRPAWTTPDGRYFVFSATPQLAGDLNKSTAEAVYRYGFGEPGKPGELTWVSHGAPGFKVETEGELKYRGEGKNAFLPWLAGTQDGGDAVLEDFNRAMSGESEAEAPGKTPEERHDGEYIIFGTSEQLQANDINNAVDVYEWRCSSPCKNPAAEGTVSMISDGHDPQGVAHGEHIQHENFGMSASGSDIFFTSHTPLVGQDTDVLRDVYDARVGGGFPAPVAPLACAGEACQGAPSPLPSFGPAASSSSPAGGNLTSPAIKVAPIKESKPRELTRAQKLARALKACQGKPKKKRAACQSQARRKYGGKAQAKAKKTLRRGA